MSGSRAWRIWYTLITPLRFCAERIESARFWRWYARIKQGRAKPEGKPIPEPARKLIENAETIEVFTLTGDDDPTGFMGWRVVGRTMVEDVNTRNLLAERLLIANEASGRGAMCIDGEYGVRATSGGTTIDLMMCFECGNVWVRGPAGYSGKGNICWIPVGDLLNKILTQANIPIPEPHG
jgi:hypothetical protein